MEITDCPYAVGTPEHSRWVNEVYIPSKWREPDFVDSEQQRAGAASIGGELVNGQMQDYSQLDVYLMHEISKLFGVTLKEFAEEIMKIGNAFSEAVEEVTKDFEPQGILLYDQEDHKKHQKKIKQTCIPHGKPKSSCRKCNRR